MTNRDPAGWVVITCTSLIVTGFDTEKTSNAKWVMRWNYEDEKIVPEKAGGGKDIGYWILDIGYWIFDIGELAQYPISNIQYPISIIQKIYAMLHSQFAIRNSHKEQPYGTILGH
jgi:hypothetical protein